MENAQPEPSMEEILASIRRIISEDEEEGAPEQARPAAPARPALTERAERPQAAAAKPSKSDEDEDDGAKSHLETEDVEMIKKNVAAAAEEDAILDESSADAASAAFSSLSQSVRVSDGPGKTLEDIVVEMLRPMVKEWLNANLPAIVEEKVEEEVQRVARRRR